jgi:hypothetical protein
MGHVSTTGHTHIMSFNIIYLFTAAKLSCTCMHEKINT